MNFTYDLYRYEGRRAYSFWIKVRDIMFTPPIQYIFLLRKTQNARNLISRYFWFFFLKLCSWKFGIQIPYQTKIGSGFRILHWGCIVINPGSIIGKNFNIAEGCLIGGSQGKSSGIPVIGDNVVMGANSIVLGGVKIGNDVLIAPGAFVNFNVPDNSVVIGNPGIIKPQTSSPTEKYEIYRVDCITGKPVANDLTNGQD